MDKLEVWIKITDRKVMFSEASVSHSVNGGGGAGCLSSPPLDRDPPPKNWHLVDTAAVGTHPTGTHSCYNEW